MKLELNQEIKQETGFNVFCNEDYAKDLLKLYENDGVLDSLSPKDITKGDILHITKINGIRGNEVDFEVNNVTNVTIDMKKEKKFLELFDININEFLSWILSDNGVGFLSNEVLIYIEDDKPVKGSLLKGHNFKLKKELIKEITNPTSAYKAKVINKNQGGFIVNILGLDAFLPGSLASANKINNFEYFIGKTINVMVEDYLEDIGTFIVSNKKYIEHVLPIESKKIDLNKKHTGIVTGTCKFGVFVEFYEIFTGLLHTSKMKKDTENKFRNNEFVPDEEIECYIKEISKNYRFVLTDYSPEEQKELDKELKKSEKEQNIKVGDIQKSIITSIKHFGVFVKFKNKETEYIGLIPINELKNTDNLKEKNEIETKIINIKNKKIFLTLNE